MDTTTDQLLQHADFVRRLARGLLSDRDAAEDLAQDTLAAALERPHVRAPRAWLAAVARRLAARHLRGEARRARRETAAARRGPAPAPDEIAAQAEMQRRLAEEVRALEEPYRTVVILRYFHDLPPREIARKLGAPYETVHARLRRAHALLRRRLDETHGHRAWLPLVAALAWPRRTVPAAAALGVAVAAALSLALLALGRGDRGGTAPRAVSEGEPEAVTPRAAEGTTTGEPAAAPPARTDLVRATGRVTTLWGRGIPGARVVVMPWVRWDYWEQHPLPPAPAAEATAAADGSFSIDAPASGRWILLAHAPGLMWKGIHLALDRRRDFLDVRLEPGSRMAGVVVDEAGAPVAGARVRGVADGAEVPGAFARTGQDGRFALDGVAWVHVDHDALTTLEGGGSCPRDRVRVVLGRGETVTGDVVAADGATVPGARIQLSGWPPTWYRSGTADGQGRFVLDGLPMQEKDRFAVAVDGGAHGNLEIRAVSFAPGMHVPVRLPAVITVRGRVVELRGDRVLGPVVGVRVACGMRVGAGMGAVGWPAEAVTDDEGRFELEGVAEDRAEEIEVADPAFFRDWKAEVPDVAPDEKGIAVRRVGSASGRVVDDKGRPVAGAVLRVVATTPGSFRPSRDPQQQMFGMDDESPDCPASDGQGMFRIPVGVAANVRVWALKRGFLRGCTEPFAIGEADERTGLVIRLMPGVVLRGRVSDPAGGPIAGATIDANGRRAFTDEQGGFALGGLTEGPTTVQATCPGYQLRMIGTALPKDDPLSLVLEPSLTFRGRLRTAEGEPLPFALLGRSIPAGDRQKASAGQGDWWTRSLEDGSFAFRDLAAGSFSLGLRERGWEIAEPKILYDPMAPGVADVLVRRKSALAISGVVRDGNGQPFPIGDVPHVTAMPEGTDDPTRWRSAECRQDGSFTIENVEDVEHVLTVRTAKALFEERRVNAGANDVRIAPARARKLAGRVLGADGQPVSRCEVRAVPPGKGPRPVRDPSSRKELRWPVCHELCWTDPEGGFRFERLAVDRVTIWALHPEHQILAETIATDQEGVELRLPAGLTLSGVLLDAERRPLAEHQLVVAGADRSVRQAKTDANGAFAVRGLPEGACEVSVTDKNGRVVLETTVPAATEGTELRLPAR